MGGTVGLAYVFLSIQGHVLVFIWSLGTLLAGFIYVGWLRCSRLSPIGLESVSGRERRS